nr:type IIL restriction-modification enzyme MmeI [Candidatus Desulfovibrio trichonymphae]
MVSDFENIVVYRRATAEKTSFKTKDLRKHIKRFAGIAGYEAARTYENPVEVNVRGRRKNGETSRCAERARLLEVHLVRLLFCLFADDTGIFQPDSFLRGRERFIRSHRPPV